MQMCQCVMCKIALLLYSDCRSKHVLPSSVFSPGFYQDQGVVGCGATGGGGGGGAGGGGGKWGWGYVFQLLIFCWPAAILIFPHLVLSPSRQDNLVTNLARVAVWE